MVVTPSFRAKAPLKKRRSSSALKQTQLPHPVSRPQGMKGVEETAKDTTAPTGTGSGSTEPIIVDSPPPSTSQTASPAAASAQSAPASTTTTTAQPGPDQSGAAPKAS